MKTLKQSRLTTSKFRVIRMMGGFVVVKCRNWKGAEKQDLYFMPEDVATSELVSTAIADALNNISHLL